MRSTLPLIRPTPTTDRVIELIRTLEDGGPISDADVIWLGNAYLQIERERATAAQRLAHRNVLLRQLRAMIAPGERTLAAAKSVLKLLARYERGNYAFSPIISSAKCNGASARVVFQNAYRGLKTSDGKPVRGFEVMDSGGGWHEAQVQILSPAIIVSAQGIGIVKSVRYCWSDNPSGNLVNSAGLPATPFMR